MIVKSCTLSRTSDTTKTRNPNIYRPKKSPHFLMKLPDNFQMREHSWPCRFRLKIIWQFHAHPVHQKVSRFFGPRYIGDDFFLGPNLVSFNRAVVPYKISKVNIRVETKIQKKFNKLKNINISKTS